MQIRTASSSTQSCLRTPDHHGLQIYTKSLSLSWHHSRHNPDTSLNLDSFIFAPEYHEPKWGQPRANKKGHNLRAQCGRCPWTHGCKDGGDGRHGDFTLIFPWQCFPTCEARLADTIIVVDAITTDPKGARVTGTVINVDLAVHTWGRATWQGVTSTVMHHFQTPCAPPGLLFLPLHSSQPHLWFREDSGRGICPPGLDICPHGGRAGCGIRPPGSHSVCLCSLGHRHMRKWRCHQHSAHGGMGQESSHPHCAHTVCPRNLQGQSRG
jgi:hypothetical protein